MIKDNSYYQITGWMINRLNLSGCKLQLFAIIYGFSHDGKSRFKGSLAYLQSFTGSSRSTVIRSLDFLTESNLLFKYPRKEVNKTFNDYAVNIDYVESIINQRYQNDTSNDFSGIKMNNQRYQNDMASGIKMKPHNNSINNNKDNNKTVESSSTSKSKDSLFNDIKEYYHEWHKTNTYYQGLENDWIAAEFAGLKRLIPKLKKLGNPKKDKDLNIHAFECFKGILNNFEHWGDEFYKQSGIRKINTNFNSIIINIKREVEAEEKNTQIPKSNQPKRMPKG